MFRESVGEKKKFQNPTIHVSIVSQGTSIRCQYDEHALWSCSSSKRNLPFLPGSRCTIAYFFGESYNRKSFGWRATATSKAILPVTDMGLKETQRHKLHGDAKKHVSAWQGLYLKISRNRTAGCLQERKQPGANVVNHSKTPFFF